VRERSAVADDERDGRLPVGRGQEAEDDRELVRRAAGEGAVELRDLPGLRQGMEDDPAQYQRAERMEAVL
jgi:hypothetical protein